MTQEPHDTASPPDRAPAAIVPGPAPKPPESDVSTAALHAWLERHKDDTVSDGEEERYESYLKGPTGFCA